MVKLKVYSQAFFDVAKERNSIEKYNQEAQFVISVLKNEKDLESLLNHPEISITKKFNLLKALFEDKISEDFLGLFNIILIKRRESAMLFILEEFLKCVREHDKTIIAKVFTPILPDDEQQNKIKTKLKGVLGKEVVLEIIIDPNLVAGLKIVADGSVIDTSFTKQLTSIRNNMYAYLAKEVVYGT